MNINIKLKEDDTIILDFDNLYNLKIIFEQESVEINNIKFDTDAVSLQRLKMLSYLNKEIQFKDANNSTISLSGSEIGSYIPLIEGKLGERYEIVNLRYNTFKTQLSANQVITHYNAVSAFYEDVYGIPFTENEYTNMF